MNKTVVFEKSVPKIVCLCGSTRFRDEFTQANFEETMKGNIVLSVGFYAHSPVAGEQVGCSEDEKVKLDELHKRKIDLCDEIFVLNVNGYVGSSTKSEIEYAIGHGKPVRYLEVCRDCHQPLHDSRYHFEAHGTNWGAALHHYKAPETTDYVSRSVTFNFAPSVPKDQIDTVFIQGMIDRMCFGFHNYGHARRTHDRPDNLANVKTRVDKYRETGNIEWLMDAANFVMMEFMVPTHPQAHFVPTSRDESPGSHVAGRMIKGKDELKPAHNVRQPKEGD